MALFKSILAYICCVYLIFFCKNNKTCTFTKLNLFGLRKARGITFLTHFETLNYWIAHKKPKSIRIGPLTPRLDQDRTGPSL